MAIEKYGPAIYAGVLGKIIGVYLGRPVEGWPYQKIQQQFGAIQYYVHEAVGVPLLVADDDISGTFAFFRALEDNGFNRAISARDIGDTWLNYIIENKTILWWGGLGRSTEHTAYLRLKEGITAPASGSMALNGKTLAEQIGAQIFCDAFAMMSPGDPERAVSLIRKAASVSHDGLAVDAACFLGAMEALAFDSSDINALMDAAMPYVATDYLKSTIAAVREICAKACAKASASTGAAAAASESVWREVRAWLDEHYGYDKFAGPCHIIPNHAMVLAALLLGGDDFQKSIMIAASAGWDTDCNAGNVGCLNGIRLKLAGICGGADFRQPVADLMYVVTADGGSCVTDAVQETRKIIRAAAAFRDEALPGDQPRYGFDFQGSVQGFALCPYARRQYPAAVLGNLNETGPRNGLLIDCRALAPGNDCCLSTPVFLDFAAVAQNFSTIASPTLYASQTVTAHLEAAAEDNPTVAFYILYYDADNEVRRLTGAPQPLAKGLNELRWQVPDTQGMPIFRLGIALSAARRFDGKIALLDLDWRGAPREFAQRGMLMTSIWNLKPFWLQTWASSAEHFAPDFKYTYCISHPGRNGVATLGTQDWEDYAVTTALSFNLHHSGGVVLRSKGHRRYYAALLSNGDTAAIIMRRNGEIKVLSSVPFRYEEDRLYQLRFLAKGNELTLMIDGACVLKTADLERNYCRGAAGFIVEQGTVLAKDFIVNQI